MTMHGALHPKSAVDRVYRSREMGGRGLISCEGCIRMEENKLRWYVRNWVEPLIEGVKVAETIKYNDTVNKKEFKQRWMREKKELWQNKRICGKRNMVLAEKSWLVSWIRSHVVWCARTSNSNKLCETKER